jgi:serine/threonine protein kinase
MKSDAEKLFALVMPLADRNLFTALKQEHWPGKNPEEIRHVFSQLVHCVAHLHDKGVLHGDLKVGACVCACGSVGGWAGAGVAAFVGVRMRARV